METNNIFIDTQAFQKHNFKFECPELSHIRELGKDKQINIYISEVIKEEVTGKIKAKISKARDTHKELMRELNFLDESLPEIFKNSQNLLCSEDIEKIAIARWERYISESNIQILDPNSICNRELIDLYFKGEKSFNPGKKKHEFPDAISLLSLKNILDQKKQKAYVISEDNDLKGYCNSNTTCLSLDQISAFLNIYNKDKKSTSHVEHLLALHENRIIETIKEAFEYCGFEYEGNYHDNHVEDVSVTNIEIQEMDIIKIGDGFAEISIEAEIACTAEISGPNHDSAIYDSETKETIFIDYFQTVMPFSNNYNVTLNISFSNSNEIITNFSEVLFDGRKDILLPVEDY
ncbi:PIN domain-containing protein [Microbulbifer variabilis]|uniref:PIN domain-containing protein n=1 Tax=Microbulbifer variabilis TaxID=266805 RepID=UPI001CFDAE65|nr:PIN domain-containing protein [Microbulbifer variabilis]